MKFNMVCIKFDQQINKKLKTYIVDCWGFFRFKKNP